MNRTPLEIIETELNAYEFNVLVDRSGSFTFDSDEVSGNYIKVHAQNDTGILIEVEYNEENYNSEDPRLTITDGKTEGNFAISYPKRNDESDIISNIHTCIENVIKHAAGTTK